MLEEHAVVREQLRDVGHKFVSFVQMAFGGKWESVWRLPLATA